MVHLPLQIDINHDILTAAQFHLPAMACLQDETLQEAEDCHVILIQASSAWAPHAANIHC